jgi:acyl-CoA synthetase (AMP-forming)/AMP-acid ligase II
VICSGEALTLEHQERFFARLAPQLDTTELHNLYGPTEAAVDVTFWACRREESRGTVPIGHPVANTQIHLLDRELRPVPVGIPGELYIGGVQLALGYHGRPDLTADRFIPDPFHPTDRTDPSDLFGGRLYRTGDLARRLPDGAVEYIGRIDHQIKLRGFRIELGEIEAVLRRLPGVKEALVLSTWPSPRRRTTPSRRSSRSGRRCCASPRSAPRTTSSTSAAIRCCSSRCRTGCRKSSGERSRWWSCSGIPRRGLWRGSWKERTARTYRT